MASLIILYWRDIPAQVIAKSGRQSAKRPLSLRFTAAIDRAAMVANAADAEAYLAQWRRGEPAVCGEDLESEADHCAQALEARYDAQKLAELSLNGGMEAEPICPIR